MCNSSCKSGGNCGASCACATEGGADAGLETTDGDGSPAAESGDPSEIKCPDCGGKIERGWTCPGYEMDKGKIFRCSFGCSNAQSFTCEDCGWRWQDELHQLAYNFAENEARRPPWADYI